MFSIIIVNYKSKDFLLNCLESLEKYLTPLLKNNWEIIIVNNDNLYLLIEKKFNFPIKILEINQNLGFGGAVNLGAKKANGDFLFFLNPDTFLKNDSFKNFLDYLKKEDLKKNPEIFGLQILEENGEIQEWSCGDKTSLFSILTRNFFSSKKWESEEISKVDWVSGGAMIVGKKVFEKLGGFDDKFFMYFEDQDLCLRAKKMGVEIVYFPFSQVYHLGGKSWEKKEEQKKEYYKSQDYFFQKHFSKWQSWVLRFFRRVFK